MASKAKSTTHSEAPITWRDGIHISGTSIWCDAKRARDICFVSAAGNVRGIKHEQLISTPDTITALQALGQSADCPLSVPFGHPFTLGTHRLELFSSGHGFGTSSLLVTTQERAIVYAGAISPNPSALSTPLDHRRADVLVLSARYSPKQFRFQPPKAVISALAERCEAICSEGGVALLLVRSACKALDVAAQLQSLQRPISAHRSFHAASKITLPGAAPLPAITRWNAKAKGGRIVLWPLQGGEPHSPITLPKNSSKILVSGAAVSSKAIAAAGASEGFAWSNDADHNALVQYIQSAKAKHIYLTHTSDRGRAIAEALPHLQIEAIGPPEQLHLFSTGTLT